MEIYKNYLQSVCDDLTKKFCLDKENRHITMLHSYNNPKQITFWAIIDKDNNVIETFNDIQKLIDKYTRNKNE